MAKYHSKRAEPPKHYKRRRQELSNHKASDAKHSGATSGLVAKIIKKWDECAIPGLRLIGKTQPDWF